MPHKRNKPVKKYLFYDNILLVLHKIFLNVNDFFFNLYQISSVSHYVTY